MQEQNLDSAFVHYYVTQSKIKISKDKKKKAPRTFIDLHSTNSFSGCHLAIGLRQWCKTAHKRCENVKIIF